MHFFKILVYNIVCLSLALAGVIDDGSARSVTSFTENQELERAVPEPVAITSNSKDVLLSSTGNTKRTDLDKTAAGNEDMQDRGPGILPAPHDAELETMEVEEREVAITNDLIGRDDP
ncbi:hypothetical protein CORC01_02321 [Colletotrichum orchidophilum]|uniref:Uncharacterized protein n=1 Tax=Colletotrichum orchidophilum TaxID=1209926 RepID=A0A1G4BM00_9PEZI|nr:uncharacterized protein CORC01_02321 [Colletotrichum orchidophilum]OHF02328.1 hypothetical protein CORC01_02321 [Colletotrichum orchidophilum]